MAKFLPGQSGNPNGRPKKERALTDILERAGSASLDVDGKSMSGKRLIGALAWQGLTTGEINFPDGKTMQLSPQDWKDLLKWVYGQIDGPPKQAVDLTTGGEKLIPVIIKVGIDPDKI